MEPTDPQHGIEAVHESGMTDQTGDPTVGKPIPAEKAGGPPQEQPHGNRRHDPDSSAVLNVVNGVVGAIATTYVTTGSIPITIIAALVAMVIAVLITYRK